MASKRKSKPKKKKAALKKKTPKRRVVKRRPKPRVKAKKKRASPVEKPHSVKPVAKPAEEETIHKTKVRVVGIGGGGGSIVSEIASKIRKADFLVANTDARALKEASKGIKKFQFGQNFTKGLGTGMNMELGETAAENEKEKIKKVFEGQDLCIIIACLGGGTSSGAVSTFARVARSLGVLTLGIFTLPFEFEGQKKMEMAKKALEKTKPILNAYLVIPNERIFQIIDKNTPFKSTLSAINKKLAENLEGLIEMIYLPGMINIDFADLRTILDGRGRLVYLNTLAIEKTDKEEAIKKVVSSPLYPYNIKGARGILYDITGGKDLQLSEVSEISKTISELLNKSAKIIFGISQNNNYKNKIKITILATGCTSKFFGLQTPSAFEAITSTIKKLRKNTAEVEAKKRPKKTRRPKPPKKEPASRPTKKSGPNKPKSPSPIGQKPRKRASLKNKKTGQATEIPVKVKTSKPKKVKSVEEKNPQLPLLKSGPQNGEVKIRRTALELKKAVEEEEKKILEEEKAWETPAIFRKKQIQQ